MSRSQPSIPTAGQDETRLPGPSNPMAERRQQTAADFRPPRPLHKESSATASSIGRYVNNNPNAWSMSRPFNERNCTAPMRIRRTGTGVSNQTLLTNSSNNATTRAQKKRDQTVEVDNEYFELNPWYNQQKDKPVFGLASPLPRTVRRGMRWGKLNARKSLERIEERYNDGVERNDGLDFDKTRDVDSESVGFNGSPGHHNPLAQTRNSSDYFSGAMPDRDANIRQQSSTANEDNSSVHTEGHERAPVNEHGLTTSDQSEAPTRNHFGLADGLHPLQELESQESETQKEKEEIKRREHEAQQEYYNQYRNPIARLRAQYPQAPAEFLATFVYLFLGICVNLSVATSQSATGSFETQAWGWGFAVMIGIYLGGGVSGAHLSPTISLSLTIYRGFPWKMAVVYICMQMLAGLCAGALAFALYRDAIYHVDPDLTLKITGSALFPKGPSFSVAGGFFNDFVYMAIYVCIAFALGDDQNSPPGQGMSALIFGFTGFITMVALGYNTGLGISPARDLGPRLIGLWVGYGDAFKGWYWAYGPFGASAGGALFGGLIYDLFIFVGGESPVNYRWPQPSEIKEKIGNGKRRTKDKIQQLA